jgi:hypothetical protein
MGQKMNPRLNYWKACLPEILIDHGLNLPTETTDAIAQDITTCAELESEALGYTNIPNPLTTQIKQLQQQLKDAQAKAETREEAYRKDIAARISPRTEPRQVFLKDGQVEIWPK